MPPRLSRTERDRLKEAVKYQDLGKGLGPRLAKVLAGGVDGLLDQMETLVGRYAKEIGDSPANASRWLSSVWGPYDRDWLYKVAGSLPEPLAGKWAAAVAAMRRDRQVSRRKAIAYASRMTAEMIEQRATEVAGPPLGKVAEEASARTAYQVSKAAGVGFSFSLPNQAQIERVMKSAGVSKQIKGFSQAAVKAVEDEVVSGMMAGESIEDIARRIRKNSDVETMVRARRIARTMSTDCAAEAKLMEYQEIGVEEYEIRCVYDERTCATCGAMDKKRFPVAGAHPRPSFHPNCRCLVVQVLPPELADRLTRSARDENGKTIQVPQSMTFEEWRDRYAKGTAAPGKAKAVQNRPSPAPRPRRVYQVPGASPTPPKPSPAPPKPKPAPPKPAPSPPKPKPSPKQTTLPVQPPTPTATPTPAPAQTPPPTPPKPLPPKAEVDKIGNLKAEVGEDASKEIQAIIDKAPETMQRAIGSVEGDLRVDDSKSKNGTFFNPRTKGITFNLAEQEKGCTIPSLGNDPATGKPYQFPPYEEVWHEFGHNMDYVLGQRTGAHSWQFASDTYRSKKHTTESTDASGTKVKTGYTLSDMVKKEVGEWVDAKLKELKSKSEDPKKVRKYDAYQEISKDLKSMSPVVSGDLSDMVEGATKGRAQGPMGHGKSYWNNHDVGWETFAEMTSATMTNPESLALIKKHLPKSYEIYQEIIEEAGNGNI